MRGLILLGSLALVGASASAKEPKEVTPLFASESPIHVTIRGPMGTLASNRAEVLVGGRRRPIRGRIAMDQFVIETDGDVRIGDAVVLFGDPATGAPSAADWAPATAPPRSPPSRASAWS